MTDVGHAFLVEARDILARADTAIACARRMANGQTGLLRLGYAASTAFHPLLPSFVRLYRERYPEVRLILSEGNTAKLCEQIADKSLDVTLIRPPYSLPKNFVTERLVDESMLVALPANHRLRKAKSIKLSQLADDNFLLFPRHIGIGLFDNIMQACISAGFVPCVEQEVPQMTSIIGLVAGGLGVALVPECMSNVNAAGVLYKPLQGNGPHAWLDVVYDRQNTAATVKNSVTALQELTQ